MRTIAASLLLCSNYLLAATFPLVADSTGLPGDHFDLPGALELFKNAKDLESFERSLNDPNKHVNNLDLNADNNVDYVRVVDLVDGTTHAVTLQVVIGPKDAQDIAVIGVEKTGDGQAVAQIIGDEALYGKDAIYEPIEEKIQRKGAGGPSLGETYYPVLWVNAWGWPCVSWFYGPSFVVWVSPWYWDYYPGWWSPWRPWSWRAHWGYCAHYHGWYRHSDVIHVTHANAYYGPRRTTSEQVSRRNAGERSRSITTDPARRDQPIQGGGQQDRVAPPSKAPAEQRVRSTEKKPTRSEPQVAPRKETIPRATPTPSRNRPSQKPAPSKSPGHGKGSSPQLRR